MKHVRTLSLVLSLVLVFMTPAAPARASAPQGCDGCMGTGGSASSSGGSCGGMVSISVTVVSGACKWVVRPEPLDLQCRPIKGCVPIVTRTWSGLDPDSVIDFCVLVGGENLCLDPKPTAGGTGAGSDTRSSAPMPCNSDPNSNRSFSVNSPSCGLFASTEASCSSCDAVF